jgi:hypothetical protein
MKHGKQEISRTNKTVVKRAEWMYSQNMVEKMRKERRQKRGSVGIEVPTESERKNLVREGIAIDSEWYRVTVWDVAMRETQCFRCWKWEHSQTVCNASEELCGIALENMLQRSAPPQIKSMQAAQHANRKGIMHSGSTNVRTTESFD